jgi:putative transcriptional regulator
MKKGAMEALESYTFKGKLLVAAPHLQDPFFTKSVILVTSHDVDGAMGFMINRPLPHLSLSSLLEQLDVQDQGLTNPELFLGGPVEGTRGFVLHSNDRIYESTMSIGNGLAMTATVEVLLDLANGVGPKNSLITLGYTSWEPDQLEEEVNMNMWVPIGARPELIFQSQPIQKWGNAFHLLGTEAMMMMSYAGHA